MDNKIKSAFDEIYADSTLKADTKSVVYSRMNKRSGRKTQVYRLLAAAACALIVLLAGGGYFSYTVPAAAVSIDINPSIELQLNIYNRVIDVKGYNDDGEKLAQEFDVKNMNCAKAIDSILKNEDFAEYTSSGQESEITVTSSSQKRADKLQSEISEKTQADSDSVYCLHEHSDVEAAHAAGLSFGKYRAFLELQKLDPSVTAQDVKDMTMHEIRSEIAKLSGSDTVIGGCQNGSSNAGNREQTECSKTSCSNGEGQSGKGHGKGHGSGGYN